MSELSEVLIDVWSQVLVHDSKVVKVGSETFPVIRSKKKRFRQLYFVFDGMSITGLEQNPDTKLTSPSFCTTVSERVYID
jgi:hypothetical protein